MQPGNLRTPVIFQEKSASKDSRGQDVHTWVPFSPTIKRSASIKPIRGREVMEARAVSSELLVSIMVRYDSDTAAITPELHRVVEQETGIAYAIHAVSNIDNRNEWLEFSCSEGLKDG